MESPQTIARELLHAFRTGATIPPLDPGLTIADAYAIEAEFRRLRISEGRLPTGRKVGYANKAMWRVLKLETLVWASMYDDTVIPAHPSELQLANLIAPKIEPEIVFKLRTEVDREAPLEAVEWMALGFEIIDCPFPDWQFTPAAFIAAYGLHRKLIVGEPAPPGTPEELAGFKLKLFKDGQLIDEGAGRNSLRSPALCLAELARITPLAPGEIVSTGTLTNAQFIAPAEVWRAEVEGLSLPPLTLRTGAPA